MVDNIDWFRDMNYLTFLREVGKSFSMTQLLDRQFVQNRIGDGGCGISYAEFSYTLIQGYDFLHLYRKYGVNLQLCGADQYGNCASGIHLIRRLENAEADIWSTPLVIDPATGRKFGKSEGNAIWLAATPARLPNGEKSENYTNIFDFYQFWLNQPDSAVEYLLKIYTIYDKTTIEQLLKDHAEAPEKRIAQKALALGATSVVHSKVTAGKVAELTDRLFGGDLSFSASEIESFAGLLPDAPLGVSILDDLVTTGLAPSKSEARKLIKAGAVSINGEKTLDDTRVINFPALIKKGKNKFAIVC